MPIISDALMYKFISKYINMIFIAPTIAATDAYNSDLKATGISLQIISRIIPPATPLSIAITIPTIRTLKTAYEKLVYKFDVLYCYQYRQKQLDQLNRESKILYKTY